MSSGWTGTSHIAYADGVLCCERVALPVLAERFATPLYVYSSATITERYQAVRAAFGPATPICYAVKANSNLALLRLLGGLGAGFDVVSGGELARLGRAELLEAPIVFAGVGKQEWELAAAMRAGILLFNVETEQELGRLAALGRVYGRRVPIALRVNPELDADTHAYIRTGARGDKFGFELAPLADVVGRVVRDPALELLGYHVHLGSQLCDPQPYIRAFERVAAFVDGAIERGRGVRYYNLGGGFGVGYGKPERVMDLDALAAELLPRLAARGWTAIVEPGRSLVADAGVLLTRVLGVKTAGSKRLVVVDAAMNDLLRPALYQAQHPVAAVVPSAGPVWSGDLVGPVCESADFLARDCALPELRAGDLVAVLSTGAYGMSMASTYNSRPRPAEVLVAGGSARLIRRRETLDDLWRTEVCGT